MLPATPELSWLTKSYAWGMKGQYVYLSPSLLRYEVAQKENLRIFGSVSSLDLRGILTKMLGWAKGFVLPSLAHRGLVVLVQKIHE
jgi:hypothetical protein